MTLTDDESDLSETLSSAGSTVPLPSSELGSRAASEDPTSPSGLASSSKTASKFDRRRKSRFIKSKINHPNHSLPTPNPDHKDPKPKKTRPATRPIGPIGSSSSTPYSDRSIKAESLPPPNLENTINRSNPSSATPRPNSAKGIIFELKPLTNPPENSIQLSNPQLRHPCTSHGHLPLFEQPVLVQGARPRRKPHPMTLKNKKSNKGRKPRAYGSANKPRTPLVDQVATNQSNLDRDGSSTPQLPETFKDEESSLTEQSSSDEASLTDRQPLQSPSTTPSLPLPQTLPQTLDQEPAASSSKHPWPDPSPKPPQSSPSSIKPSLPCQDLLANHATSSTIPTSSESKPLTPIVSSSYHPNPIEISNPNSATPPPYSSTQQLNGPTQPHDSPNACHAEKVNGRKTSEESALTPEPEDLGRSSTARSTRPNLTTSAPSHAPCLTRPSSLNALHPPAIFTSPPHRRSPDLVSPSVKCSSPPTLLADISSPFVGLNHKPRPPNIIPPSTLKLSLGVSPIVEGHPHSAASITDRSPASTVIIGNCHEDDTFHQQEHSIEDLADEALDGEPITDDLMDYELELGDEEPTLEALLNLRREPSEAGTSAVDGVPVPDSEDPIEDLEIQPSLDPQTIPQTHLTVPDLDFPSSPQPPPPPPPKSRVSPESELELPQPRPEKPKQSKTFSSGLIYEHDDHVRRREDALEAMVKIEIMFAQVRDRLYVERMADVHRETAAIQHGSHPELNEYCQMLERKRDARLSLAHKIFNLKEIELNKKRDAAMNSVWTKWHETKTELHDRMILETQKHMKQLEREKCQPDLRYNVEVQLLPRPIIPRITKRNRTRKRARLDLDEETEEVLAIQLHTAISKRATVNLATLTAEESWADLSVMKPQLRNSHLDPVNILCAPSHHNPIPTTGYHRDCRSQASAESAKKFGLSTLDPPCQKLNPSNSMVDPAVAGAEKLITLNPKLLFPSRSSPSSQSHPNHLNSSSSSSESSHKYPLALRLNGSGSDSWSSNVPHTITSSCSRTVRNSNQRPSSTSFDPIETNSVTDSKRIGSGSISHGYYNKSDRRPTLDSVMAHNQHNTPERLKSNCHHHHPTHHHPTHHHTHNNSHNSYHHHHHNQMAKGNIHTANSLNGNDGTATTSYDISSNPTMMSTQNTTNSIITTTNTACLGSSSSQINHLYHHPSHPTPHSHQSHHHHRSTPPPPPPSTSSSSSLHSNPTRHLPSTNTSPNTTTTTSASTSTTTTTHTTTTQLYPAVPISVNYHERVKTQIA